MENVEIVPTVIIDRPGANSDKSVGIDIRRQAWYWNALVRGGRTFLQVFLALLAGATVIPAAIPADMAGFVLLPFARQAVVAAQLAGLAAGFAVLQNLAEILSRLDVNIPEARG